jgi:transposase
MPERRVNRDQPFLLPPSFDDWIGADHVVRVVAEFIASLPPERWAAMGIDRASAVEGRPRYEPAMLLSVYLFGFMSGIRSSRRLEAACRELVPMRWLTGGLLPDHSTLWSFYDRHRPGIQELFRESVQLAVNLDLVDLALAAVDGTKIRANAAGERGLTATQLRLLGEQTELAIADLDAQHRGGEGATAVSVPPALRGKQTLHARITEARAQLRDAAESARVNVTDPEARQMKSRQGTMPGYNAQAAVVGTNERAQAILGETAPGGRIVVGAMVTTDPSDNSMLSPMLTEIVAMTGRLPEVTVADAGYFGGATLTEAKAQGATVVVAEADHRAETSPFHRAAFLYDAETDTLTCPQGQVLHYLESAGKNSAGALQRRYGGIAAQCRGCPHFGVCTTSAREGRRVTRTEHDDAIMWARAERAKPEHQATQKRRRGLIEGVFGVTKTAGGLRQWQTRGQEKVGAEWTMTMTAFNLKTLARIWQALPHDERSRMFAHPAGA